MLKYTPTAEDFAQWAAWGAGIGLLTEHYPAVDVDVTDPQLSEMIVNEVQAVLGPAPIRTGRPPKRLLLYKTDNPFPKKVLTVWRDGERHLVEILGSGRMCVVAGTHPSTMNPYSWDRPLESITSDSLTPIDEVAVDALLIRLSEKLTAVGCKCEVPTTRAQSDGPAPEQASLEAPSIDALREAVASIPNDHEFPTRADMIEMGIAIKAASRKDWAAGLEIYLDWTARWEDGYNDAQEMIRDWMSFNPPFRRGWEWIAATAQQHGFNAAAYEFTTIEALESAPRTEIEAIANSDQDLAIRFAKRHASLLRHLPQSKSWRFWNGTNWAPDEILRAPELLKEFLRDVGDKTSRGIVANDKQAKEARKFAAGLCSARIAKAVMQLAASDARLTATSDQFDQDPWALNTKSGIVDLRSGELRAHDPSAMMSKITKTTVGSSADCPRWLTFLAETTGNDAEVIAYLQRLSGYCLTGITSEQAFVFLYGTGGNGKSVFLDTLLDVLADYGRTAPMSIFMASGRNEHPTELAGLQGARLVAANETNVNGTWNEARLKSLSGGDRIAARLMRGNYEEYTPQFKLLLVGNVKPTFSGIDAAMRRRLHLVSFDHTPPVPDRQLLEKLKLEAPGIIAWMIEGCISWQREGLNPPLSVLKATNEYLDDQDSLGRWLSDECIQGEGLFTSSKDLHAAYSKWCEETKESGLKLRQFVMQLKGRGFVSFQDSRAAGRRSLKGLALREFESPPEGVDLAPGEAA